MTNETEAMYEKEGKLKEIIKKVGKKNVAIVCAVFIISTAIILNWALFAKANTGSGNSGGNGVGAETGDISNAGSNSTNSDDTDSFFSSTQISRERARDEAMDVLQSVIDNESADDATKAAAIEDMTKLAKDMEAEANIETLIIAKVFEKCVAVINDESASIIVKCSETLTAAQLAQINEIVYAQTGIAPSGINIIEK